MSLFGIRMVKTCWASAKATTYFTAWSDYPVVNNLSSWDSPMTRHPDNIDDISQYPFPRCVSASCCDTAVRRYADLSGGKRVRCVGHLGIHKWYVSEMQPSRIELAGWQRETRYGAGRQWNINFAQSDGLVVFVLHTIKNVDFWQICHHVPFASAFGDYCRVVQYCTNKDWTEKLWNTIVIWSRLD